METKVAGILGALSQLEQDLDSLESSVSDMKKSRPTNSDLSQCAKSFPVIQIVAAKPAIDGISCR